MTANKRFKQILENSRFTDSKSLAEWKRLKSTADRAGRQPEVV